MTPKSLSDFDRDRVAVTLRRVGAIARDLRQEYPDWFETAGTSRSGTGEAADTRALPSGS